MHLLRSALIRPLTAVLRNPLSPSGDLGFDLRLDLGFDLWVDLGDIGREPLVLVLRGVIEAGGVLH